MTMPKTTAPFVTGLVAGAVIIGVLGFTNGWVVTTEARDTEVRDAWIQAQASVCASLVDTHLKKTNNTVSLDGYQSAAREARIDLARTFAVALPGDETADSIVVNACAHMLNKPNA